MLESRFVVCCWCAGGANELLLVVYVVYAVELSGDFDWSELFLSSMFG